MVSNQELHKRLSLAVAATTGACSVPTEAQAATRPQPHLHTIQGLLRRRLIRPIPHRLLRITTHLHPLQSSRLHPLLSVLGEAVHALMSFLSLGRMATIMEAPGRDSLLTAGRAMLQVRASILPSITVKPLCHLLLLAAATEAVLDQRLVLGVCTNQDTEALQVTLVLARAILAMEEVIRGVMLMTLIMRGTRVLPRMLATTTRTAFPVVELLIIHAMGQMAMVVMRAMVRLQAMVTLRRVRVPLVGEKESIIRLTNHLTLTPDLSTTLTLAPCTRTLVQ